MHRFHSSRECIEWTWVFFVLATTLDSRQTIEQARSASFRLHRESDVISDVPFLELLDSATGYWQPIEVNQTWVFSELGTLDSKKVAKCWKKQARSVAVLFSLDFDDFWTFCFSNCFEKNPY